jgi:putative cell wall-binding protein
MGADCPDTTGCNSISAGFFAQVYKSAWQMKRYANPSGTSNYFTWYAPGHTWNILYNPNTACGTKAVYVKNQATADLYYYTPYTPNAAALNAGYGTGDSCSAYGNRNFYNYFVDWFGSTQIPANACTPPTAAQIAPASGEFVVNVASLNGRIAPSTSCPTGVVSLPQGTILTRLGTWDTWTQVRLNGQVMWVASQYLVAAPPVAYTTTRIAGADRYATAAAIAQQSNPNGASTVYLASGENFADALSGASLAALKSAPMLLTAAGALPQPTAAALAALHPASVVILGGETAVSPAVLDAAGAIVGQANVSRVSGVDRYSTSLAVVESGWKSASVAYLATGSGFADALAASAVAGGAGAPVLLADGALPTLSPALVTELQNLRVGKVIIAGGPQAVSAGIAAQLGSLGIAVDRRAGSDRYQTSALLAADAASAAQSFMSSGTNFPDALAGAVMAGRLKSPLLTSPVTCMADVSKDFLIAHGATKVTLFGGPEALNADVLASVRC